MVIDAHLHFDDKRFESANDAVNFINSEINGTPIVKVTTLHLLAQKWTIEEISDSIRKYDKIDCFVNIDPFSKDSKKTLEYSVMDLGFIGMKLHPRLQNFKPNRKEVIDLVMYAGKLGVPVLIDAFPDGDYLHMGIQTNQYFELAKRSPNTKIIIAHFGGHHCIDFMMLAKRTPNIYFDFSFSWLYFRGSPVIESMLYCMKSMKFDRIFYGSDYPDRGISISLDKSIEIFEKHNISKTNMDKLFYENWLRFID